MFTIVVLSDVGTKFKLVNDVSWNPTASTLFDSLGRCRIVIVVFGNVCSGMSLGRNRSKGLSKARNGLEFTETASRRGEFGGVA